MWLFENWNNIFEKNLNPKKGKYTNMKKLTENLIQQRLKTCTTELDKVQQINVTGRELKDVSLLRKMTGVEILSLSVNQISSLADFQDCKNLRELYLRQNKISDINEIFHLKNLPKLELLMLSQNPCAEDPLYRMTVIKNLKNLTELDGIAITQDERKQAQKVGEEVFLGIEFDDHTENCIPDDHKVRRMSQDLKSSADRVSEVHEFKAHKVESREISGTKSVGEPNVKKTSSTHINMRKGKQQSPKSKKKNIKQNNNTSSASGVVCKMCGNTGSQSPKTPNILSATLNLLKELDYSSLKVINAEVRSRLNTFEANYTCQNQKFPKRNGSAKEIMHD